MTDLSTIDPATALGRAGTITLGGDLTVARMGYGAMRLTGPGIWGDPADPGTAMNVLRRAIELGITFIDTADSYGPNVNEELIAEALSPYPADLVIATKAGLVRTGPSEWHPLGRPEYLRQQAETSRRRLHVDRIDLWQLHRLDPQVPAAEQFATMKALQDEGIVRHIGLSEVDRDTLDRALEAGLEVASVQNRYNIIVRDSDPVLDRCTELGIGFIPWFPIAQGILAETGNPFTEIADDLGVTTAQLSLAWLLHKSPMVLPIPGTSSIPHLEENVLAAGIELSAEQVETISELGLRLAPTIEVPAGA